MSRSARRLSDLEGSATVALADRIGALRAAGEPVYDLAGGDPYFATPAHIRAAAARSLDAGRTHYGPSRGIPELRAAVAAGLEERSVSYDPATEVVITPSAKYALTLALTAVLEPGDEVLVPSPGWVSYGPLVELCGGRPVPVDLDPTTGFALDPGLLEIAITARTKVILVNSPNNPTGRVIGAQQLAALADLAVRHDLVVISDEVYGRIVFGVPHRSPAELIPERTVIVDGVSKAYAMTGWRLGWLAGPADIISAALIVQQHTVSCAATFVQDAAVAALTGPDDDVRTMIKEYEQRSQALARTLQGVEAVRLDPPQGAFYTFLDITGTGMRSAEFAQWLLETARVAVVPGIAFGAAGDSHARISLAVASPEYDQAVDRLAHALTGLRERTHA
jgi:aspartate aminotransferase